MMKVLSARDPRSKFYNDRKERREKERNLRKRRGEEQRQREGEVPRLVEEQQQKKKVYETAITKLNKRIQQLKSAAAEMKKQEEQQKLKQYDDEHKKEYNKLYEWSDMKLHEVSGFGQEVKRLVRSPRKSKKKEKRLNAIEETLKNIYEVDLPVKDQAVADGMCNISSLLEDKQYARIS